MESYFSWPTDLLLWYRYVDYDSRNLHREKWIGWKNQKFGETNKKRFSVYSQQMILFSLPIYAR